VSQMGTHFDCDNGNSVMAALAWSQLRVRAELSQSRAGLGILHSSRYHNFGNKAGLSWLRADSNCYFFDLLFYKLF